MVVCESCQKPVERVLGLVKDGTVYEAWRCAQGHLNVVDTQVRRLAVHLSAEDGLRIAALRCGHNCYIFDRRMFRRALRDVLRFFREGPEDVVVDLGEVGFVGEPLLIAMRFLESGMRRRGRRVFVVTPSSAVAAEIRAAAPALGGSILRRASEIELAHAAAAPRAAAFAAGRVVNL